MKKVIFDCDNTMGVRDCDVDDGLALVYLLGKENIRTFSPRMFTTPGCKRE